MRHGTVVVTMWCLVFVLAALALVVFWLQPATQDLEAALTRARSELETLEAEGGRRVGPRYENSLALARKTGDRILELNRNELSKQARAQSAWFPGLEIGPSGGPQRDAFATKYAFHQDEMRRALTVVARQKLGDAIEGIPVHDPPFVVERRLPKDLREMETAQRVATAEWILLDAASRAGAFPYQGLDAQAGWEAVSEDSLFRTMDVTLHLLMRPGDLPGVLRALLSAGENGPIISLDGLATRPRPMPARLREGEPLLIEADVHLGLSTHRR
jgi:hypothetical protein